MKETITTKWLSDLAFEAEIDGHKIYMDSSAEHGGKNTGPRPKPLMMVALAGCTGMDVASILKKMRVEIERVEKKVEFEGFKLIIDVESLSELRHLESILQKETKMYNLWDKLDDEASKYRNIE